jgi:hypothetical protein
VSQPHSYRDLRVCISTSCYRGLALGQYSGNCVSKMHTKLSNILLDPVRDPAHLASVPSPANSTPLHLLIRELFPSAHWAFVHAVPLCTPHHYFLKNKLSPLSLFSMWKLSFGEPKSLSKAKLVRRASQRLQILSASLQSPLWFCQAVLPFQTGRTNFHSEALLNAGFVRLFDRHLFVFKPSP